jgi:hypothetical protein
MNEQDFLKKFAKALGAEDVLTKIDKKKVNEEKMLKGMATFFGQKDLLDEIETKKAKEEALLKEKREKEEKLLDDMNSALSKLVSTAQPAYTKIIEKELNEIIPFVNHPDKNVTDNMVVASASDTPFKLVDKNIKKEMVVVSAGLSPFKAFDGKNNNFKTIKGFGGKPKQITFEDLQPQPELPVDDFVTAAVKDLSKSAPGQAQQTADEIPAGFRKELDLLKKSIVDLHRFASRQSQMGGGGEVNLRYLDDIDRGSISDGLFLKYDAASKKFVFATPPGSATTLEGLTDIIIDEKSDGAVIQYDINDDKYHIKPLSITSASIDSGDF